MLGVASLRFCLWPCASWGGPARGPAGFAPSGAHPGPCVVPRPAVPPHITQPPSLPGPVLLGAPVRLTCNATGVPSPTLLWLKDGNPVSTAGASGLQVRLGSPGSPLRGLRRCWEQRSGPGTPRRGTSRGRRGRSAGGRRRV